MHPSFHSATRLLRPGRAVMALAGLSLLAQPLPAAAQDNADARLRKVEAEVRALQRRVFPGSDGRFFEPEITPPAATPTTAPAAPAGTALTDVLARLDALERQLQAITAQSELGGNAVTTLTERVEALEAANRAAAAPAVTVPGAGGTAPVSGPAPAAGVNPTSAAAAPPPAVAAAATGPTAERLAAVQAITKPSTSDRADDEYVYGFRLFEAGFYPEAQQQLTMFVNANPRHRRVTYARNLLGRALLADNKPRDAAAWFLSNYQADKTAARAGDSLLGLAQAMIALNDTSRACVALAEFGDTFPALATGRLKRDYDQARSRVRCG